MSTVAAILASIAGGRNRLLVTSSPRRSLERWAADDAADPSRGHWRRFASLGELRSAPALD